jgi:hypothetical protein
MVCLVFTVCQFAITICLNLEYLLYHCHHLRLLPLLAEVRAPERGTFDSGTWEQLRGAAVVRAELGAELREETARNEAPRNEDAQVDDANFVMADEILLCSLDYCSREYCSAVNLSVY